MQRLLVDGDQESLRRVSKDALFAALKTEGQCLGLYRYGETQAEEVVRPYLSRRLDNWLRLMRSRVVSDGNAWQKR